MRRKDLLSLDTSNDRNLGGFDATARFVAERLIDGLDADSLVLTWGKGGTKGWNFGIHFNAVSGLTAPRLSLAQCNHAFSTMTIVVRILTK